MTPKDLIRYMAKNEDFAGDPHMASIFHKTANELEYRAKTNELLREALEEAILYCQFIDLSEKWRKLLKETEEKR